jgi:hypothetical protein
MTQTNEQATAQQKGGYCDAMGNYTELQIDMHNTAISKPMEQAMLEAVATSRRARVDHKKEWYVKRTGELETECAALKRELSELKNQKKASVFDWLIHSIQKGSNK